MPRGDRRREAASGVRESACRVEGVCVGAWFGAGDGEADAPAGGGPILGDVDQSSSDARAAGAVGDDERGDLRDGPGCVRDSVGGEGHEAEWLAVGSECEVCGAVLGENGVEAGGKEVGGGGVAEFGEERRDGGGVGGRGGADGGGGWGHLTQRRGGRRLRRAIASAATVGPIAGLNER